MQHPISVICDQCRATGEAGTGAFAQSEALADILCSCVLPILTHDGEKLGDGMTEIYEQTGLWQRSLGTPPQSQSVDDPITKLRSTFSTFRDRAKSLTGRIAAALPDLTIHDVTHLDGLWETADLIAGADYPLTPMEGFVLGGAILLHDAALCFEAYEHGQDGLRDTVEWKDSLAAEVDRRPDSSHEEQRVAADFMALRLLHARQAAKLGEFEWTDPNGNKLHLIDNSEIRRRYGSLIGLIASSHHWNIEQVHEKLPSQINAPGGFPREWRVDPIKIACLLRCADAAHIDDRRAPDFLYALTRRQGVSADHWKAQNWLARVDEDLADETGTSLLYTSNHDFTEGDADAWWVAFDAVSLVDKELRAANTLLVSRTQKSASPGFKMARVTGAGSPDALSEHIRVTGWKPCSAQLHVSNVQALVKSLGGSSLYGDDDHLDVVLRELIQNG